MMTGNGIFTMWLRIMTAFCSVLLLGACNGDEPVQTLPACEEGEVEVPLTISLQSAWTIDGEDNGTRAAPPGTGGGTNQGTTTTGYDDGVAEAAEVNRVRVLTFRRKEGSNDSFLYDMTNDDTFPIDGVTDPAAADGYSKDKHTHRTAHCKIKKRIGYEYRVIALAYKADDIENPYNQLQNGFGGNDFNHRVSINVEEGRKLEDVRLTVNSVSGDAISGGIIDMGGTMSSAYYNFFGTSGTCAHPDRYTGHLTSVPQFFYAECHAKGHEGDPIIKYSEFDANGEYDTKIPLTGIAYRAVSRIEVTVKHATHTHNSTLKRSYHWVALIANHVSNQTKLDSYKAFDAPVATFGSDEKKYTPIGINEVGTCNTHTNNSGIFGADDMITIKAWVLPGIMRLGLKGFCNTTAGYTDTHEGCIKAHDQSLGGSATGVVTPIVVDNKFYIRKNHRYVLDFSGESAGYDVNHILYNFSGLYNNRSLEIN